MSVNNHLCLCEQVCFKKCRSERNLYCYTCTQWVDSFQSNINTAEPSDCLTILCCPIKFPILLVGFLPCTLYNILRNKCNNTNENYLC